MPFRAHLHPDGQCDAARAYQDELHYAQDALRDALEKTSAKEYRRLRKITYSRGLRTARLDTKDLHHKWKVALVIFNAEILLLPGLFDPGLSQSRLSWLREELDLLKRLGKKLARNKPLNETEKQFIKALGKKQEGQHEPWFMTIVNSVHLVRQKR